MPAYEGLRSLFAPSSVCLVGASSSEAKITGRPLRILEAVGYPGKIFVVNPGKDMIAGRVSYPSITAVPDTVDVALVMVPSDEVVSVVEDCGAAEVKHVIIMTSGFEELANGHGRQLAAELAAISRRYELNIVGPNCEGLWSLPDRSILTFGRAGLRQDLKTAPIAILSQSGSVGASLLTSLQDLGIGCNHFISLGNETHLGMVHFLEYLLTETEDQVVFMFVEGIRDGHRLVELMALAQEQRRTIFAIKAGRSDAGQVAIQTHTGKITTTYDLYSDIFRQLGIVELARLADAVPAIETVVVLPKVAAGTAASGVGVVGISGGSRALIADACADRQVPMAVFSDATMAELARYIPAYGSVANPTDLTARVSDAPDGFERVAAAVAGDESTTIVLVQYATHGERRVAADRAVFEKIVRETGKPMIASFLGEMPSADVRASLRDVGVICAVDPRDAVDRASWLYQFSGVDRAVASRAAAVTVPTGAAGASRMLPLPHEDLMALIADCGVPFAQYHEYALHSPPDQLPVSPPVAVKLIDESIAHKSDEGFVRLHVTTADEVARLAADFATREPGGRIAVQQMVPDGLELVLAVRSDPDFGPVMTLGVGGVLVELVHDVVHWVLPADRVQIDAGIARTRALTRLLDGYRGAGRRDREALVHAIESLARWYIELGGKRPRELEFNPLLVRAEGRGVVAVDVLALP